MSRVSQRPIVHAGSEAGTVTLTDGSVWAYERLARQWLPTPEAWVDRRAAAADEPHHYNDRAPLSDAEREAVRMARALAETTL